MTKKKTESAAAPKTAPSAAAESAAESLSVIKIGAPTAADMGALATFALEGHGHRHNWYGSETSKARVMAAKLVEYRLREVAPKDTKEAVAADNADTFLKMREELKKPNPCPNRVKDLSYKLRAYHPPCSALFVTDRGWEELAKLGISAKTADKVCG